MDYTMRKVSANRTISVGVLLWVFEPEILVEKRFGLEKEIRPGRDFCVRVRVPLTQTFLPTLNHPWFHNILAGT